jgi:hypothetical protein
LVRHKVHHVSHSLTALTPPPQPPSPINDPFSWSARCSPLLDAVCEQAAQVGVLHIAACAARTRTDTDMELSVRRSPRHAAAAAPSTGEGGPRRVARWSNLPHVPRVQALPRSPPIIILPGFGNNSTDYTAPFGLEEEAMATHLKVRRAWKDAAALRQRRHPPPVACAPLQHGSRHAALPIAGARLPAIRPAAGAQGLVQRGAQPADAGLLERQPHHQPRLQLVPGPAGGGGGTGHGGDRRRAGGRRCVGVVPPPH